MGITYRLGALVLLTASAVAFGCVNTGTATPGNDLALPEGFYTTPVWLEEDVIVVARHVGPEDGWTPPHSTVLVRTDPTGTSYEELAIAPPPLFESKCQSIGYGSLIRSPDGRVLMQRECLRYPLDPLEAIVALDAQSLTVSELVHLSHNVIFTWNPDLTEGYYSAGSGICEGIRRMDRQDGALPTDIYVGEGAQRFPLEDAFRITGDADCSHTGRATQPAWSPDGTTLAFYASPTSIGLSGFRRLDEPWNLYLVQLDPRGEPVLHLSGIVYPQALAWSPDGRSLAIAGVIDGEEGTWVYEIESKSLRKITDEIVSRASWSPDGTRLIGEVGLGAHTNWTKVHIVDVAP